MYRDDGEAARQRIAALESELDALRRENESLRRPPPQPARRAPVVAILLGVIVAIAGTVAWASAPPRRAPARPARPAPVAPPDPIASLDPPASIAAPEPVAEPTPAPVPELDPLAAAIEPAHPDVIDVLAHVERGDDVFVLHRWLGALAWEHAESDAGTLEASRADVDRRRTVCEDGAEDDDAMLRCSLEEAPDRWVGTADAICEDVHALEVAHLVREEGTLAVRSRRRIVDVACGDGEDGEAELRARDVDGDGALELTVIAPFTVASLSSDTFESATIGAVLDARDLHSELVVLRDYDASYGDVSSMSRTVATTWTFADDDRDGTIEAHVRQRIADVDDEYRTSDARTADCRYDRSSDRFRCEARWVADPLEPAISGTAMADLEILR